MQWCDDLLYHWPLWTYRSPTDQTDHPEPAHAHVLMQMSDMFSRASEAAGELPGGNMEQAEGGRAGHPAVTLHHLQPRGALPGRREHVQPQNGRAAVCKPERYDVLPAVILPPICWIWLLHADCIIASCAVQPGRCHSAADSVSLGGVSGLTETHVRQQVLGFLQDDLVDRDMFLRAMNECWQSHCRQMIMVRSIFLYLDRTYVLQSPAILSIWSVDSDCEGVGGSYGQWTARGEWNGCRWYFGISWLCRSVPCSKHGTQPSIQLKLCFNIPYYEGHQTCQRNWTLCLCFRFTSHSLASHDTYDLDTLRSALTSLDRLSAGTWAWTRSVRTSSPTSWCRTVPSPACSLWSAASGPARPSIASCSSRYCACSVTCRSTRRPSRTGDGRTISWGVSSYFMCLKV